MFDVYAIGMIAAIAILGFVLAGINELEERAYWSDLYNEFYAQGYEAGKNAASSEPKHFVKAN